MISNSQHRGEPEAVELVATAVRYLAQHGFDGTTATELADAVGMSRSTFFRRFGSKEDVIFIDHDIALSRLEGLLQTSELAFDEALVRGTLEVRRVLVRDPEAAKLRSDLLRRNPALRERELVVSHRYERVYTSHLTRIAPGQIPAWVPVALAASAVAVHNAALRRWLRGTDPEALDRLENDLRELTGRFAPWFGGEDRASRVVVAAFDAGATPDEVIRALSTQLPR